MSAPERLIGQWTLRAFERRFSDTGDVVHVMGDRPSGVLSISVDYVVALITAGAREPESSEDVLFATMMAYAGSWRAYDDRFITMVTIAWHPSWIGTEQVRYYELDGDRLVITTEEQLHPKYPGRLGKARLIWDRATKFSA